MYLCNRRRFLQTADIRLMPAINYGNARDLLPVKRTLQADINLKTSDIEKIFTNYGIPLQTIGDSEVHIPYTDICAVYETAARLLGDDNFGLKCGMNWGIEYLGSFGEYGCSAASLKQCLERLINALDMYESGSTASLTLHDDLVKFSYSPGCLNPVGARHYADALIGVMIRVIQFYLGPDWLPVRLESTNKKTSQSIPVERYYSLPVEYEQPALAVIFKAINLDVPRPDMPFRRRIDTLSELDLIMNGQPPTTMTDAVSKIVQLRLLGGLIDIEGAARHMKLSVRSLQRKLSDEGETYREILNRERYRRASDLLSQSDHSITDISRLLGYEYVNDFTRAFTWQYGSSPSQFRRDRSKLSE